MWLNGGSRSFTDINIRWKSGTEILLLFYCSSFNVSFGKQFDTIETFEPILLLFLLFGLIKRIYVIESGFFLEGKQWISSLNAGELLSSLSPNEYVFGDAHSVFEVEKGNSKIK